MKEYMNIEEAIWNPKVRKPIETTWDSKTVSWFD
jgi:hypothetical protein